MACTTTPRSPPPRPGLCRREVERWRRVIRGTDRRRGQRNESEQRPGQPMSRRSEEDAPPVTQSVPHQLKPSSTGGRRPRHAPEQPVRRRMNGISIGGHGIRRLVMGSDAEVVLCTTPPPVLLARSSSGAPRRIHASPAMMNIADRRLKPDGQRAAPGTQNCSGCMFKSGARFCAYSLEVELR